MFNFTVVAYKLCGRKLWGFIIITSIILSLLIAILHHFLHCISGDNVVEIYRITCWFFAGLFGLFVGGNVGSKYVNGRHNGKENIEKD